MRNKIILIAVVAVTLLGIQAILAVPQNAASQAPEENSGAYCANPSGSNGDAQAQNPCNPCSKKQAKNPCAKKAQTPCNPCAKKAQNPCNPCAKKAGKALNIPVNPCHAKMGNVFYVADPMNRNTVTFKSRAPLEDIVGTSNNVTGYVVFDPNQPSKGGRGTFRVPVASLNTGIPLRDEHLQGADWLNAARHGEIVFEITDVTGVKEVGSAGGGKTYDLTLVGNLTVNGRTAKIQAPARVTYLPESPQTQMKMPGNLLAARTNFSVKLGDFGVKGMQGVVGSRVSETIELEISFVGTTQAPGSSM